MAKARTTGKTKTTSAKAKTTTTRATKPKVVRNASAPTEKSTIPLTPEPQSPKATYSLRLIRLNTWNKWLAGVHTLQGLAILVLATSHTFPVTTTFLNADPIATDLAGHPVLAAATKHLFEINMALLIAAFFFMSAIAHVLLATVYRRRYEADLQLGINKVRWLEYGLSASTMLVAIGLLSGIADLSTLLLIFVLSCIMNLLGLSMELSNQGRAQPNWFAYGIGCLAGIVPWVVLGMYLWGAGVYGSSHVPGFVYWIYGSMFLLFSSFAVNMYLQYKKKGKWAEYLYGERAYMILSLVAKTALAWQVFAGTLRP